METVCEMPIAVKKEGLTREHELQGYFVRRIGKFLASKNRRMMGWDEVLECNVGKDVIIQSWRGEQGGIKAANMGHHVLMSPTSFMYFDYYQGNPATEPIGISDRCIIPLEKFIPTIRLMKIFKPNFINTFWVYKVISGASLYTRNRN